MRKFWDRPLGSKLILVLTPALLLEMVGPWQRVCAVTSGDEPRICGYRTAYQGSDFGVYAAILAGAILVWELAPMLFPRLGMRGWPTAIVTAILSVGLAFCVLVKLIKDNEFQTVWAWIGFGIALAIMVTALLRVVFRWRTRHRRPERGPPDEAVHAESPAVPESR